VRPPQAVAETVAAAGACLAGAPRRHDLGSAVIPAVTAAKALYFAYARDGQLHYIGKVDRADPGGAGQRLREHLRTSRRKQRAWRILWVVPLAEWTDPHALLRLERELIRRWRPPANVQHAA